MFHSPNATWGSWSGRIPDSSDPSSPNNPVFFIALGDYLIRKTPDKSTLLSEAAKLNIGMIDISNGSGKYSETNCYWVPAIIKYDVIFSSDGHVRIDPDARTSGIVHSLANNTRAPDWWVVGESQPVTMEFLLMYLTSFVNSNSSAAAPIPGSSPDSSAGIWDMDSATYNAQSWKYMIPSNDINDLNFRDPTLDIIHSLNEMMFRAAVLASTWSNLTQLIDPGLSPDQSIIANQTVTRNVFCSDFGWYAAATALELVVVLAVLPLFWGYWTLSKHLTLSPFGMGLAFNAPILEDVDTSKGAEGVLEKFGNLHVRYGDLSYDPEKGSRATSDAGSETSTESVRKGMIVMEV